MKDGTSALQLIGLRGIPSIAAGDDIARIIVDAAAHNAVPLDDGDVLLVAQKIVSRAAGLLVNPADLTPRDEARDLAVKTGKPADVVEAILQESRGVIAHGPNVLITEHVSGCVMANAGLDQSNLPGGVREGAMLALPRDPDGAARDLFVRLGAITGKKVAVVICDSWGRPFRMGTVGFALGVAGMPALVDLRGNEDLNGRPLQASVEALADGLAAAANLVMGQGAEGVPAVIARGLRFPAGDGAAADLLRPIGEDLFR
ncbi:MAG: coenzyme F420-0:L-glutamate ligase [Novosphingobium sp.]|nr:coenzyme F420-0:L-glutamate ligase [Novosphingobium sp.]